MKIAFLTTDNREQQSDYLNPSPHFGPAPAALLQGFSQLGNEIEIHVVSCSKRRIPAPEKLADNIWFHQPIVRKLGWGRSLFIGCALAVRKILIEIQPDLVHAQGTERDCSISAVLSGYPNMITVHGIMRAVSRKMETRDQYFYYRIISALETFSLSRTNGVFCNSAYTRHIVSELTSNTWMMPNCLRPEFLNPPTARSERRKRIVVLGSIISYKQPLEILKMWSTIAHKFPDVSLTFIGHGAKSDDYSIKFFNMLTEPSIRHQTSHINHLSASQLADYLDSACGMIHFPTEESFGLAVAEGLARNLTLFAARTGGIPDVVHGCNDVKLFDADDWVHLSECISHWIQDGMQISDNHNKIASRFSPSVVARKHLEAYKEVLHVI